MDGVLSGTTLADYGDGPESVGSVTMTKLLWRLGAAGVFVGSLIVGNPAPASAQYFGPNKVQYQHVDFQILKAPPFDIYFYPEEQDAAKEVARLAERWYTRLSHVLDHDLSS